jgi:CheY-like chemotaxis protein
VSVAGRTLLVIEDDGDNRHVLCEVLSEEGYQVVGTANGVEALAWLAHAPANCDLILLDLMMPELNGWDFRTRQLIDPVLAGIPVVVLSADRDVEAHARTMSAAGFLPKPVDIEALLATVARHLRPRDAHGCAPAADQVRTS